MAENKSKVKIVGPSGKVIFMVSPGSLSESRSANYDQWNLVHLPTDLYAYRNTTSRSWEIQVQLVSRTKIEAASNSKILNTVRSWLLPDFANYGAPPDILKFSAYSDPNINEVTCILRSYSWNYPSDVDYVFDAEHKMPVIGSLGVSLVEIYSATQIQEKKWQILDIGNGSDNIANPEGFGKVLPGTTGKPTSPLNNLLPNFPGFENLTGDPLNLLNEFKTPSLNDIVKDAFSNVPSISIPPFPSFGNGIPISLPDDLEI